ncbi:uncharacterized protein YneF (UPF0154 family) [Aquimarina sp. EL_43]|uniref:hypothetical protein n=1 Tax=unclassified Aquimarina TaxID=2627091 RepID=UPI0018CAD482|nr:MULTISPECIES: hypothetical protein [unclassified Aquimarina]MBG6130335.1 uncharacterized protein YneF (UPF0154 family) [Aquimarina sp. EL_35]MBG6149115.1 uncharacterized protein YneF (UPF0154 family) [Aquimarina sp. EL_32]MBG6168511.1 uncharacterized protein YneF (UPF0154 family) [Aquimarina sp. EL_43]
MKHALSILTIILGLITIFCIGMFLQRANIEYNANGRFLSPDGVVYYEQAKQVYGILALLGVFLTGTLIYKQIKKNN